jgi:hypothetical protein
MRPPTFLLAKPWQRQQFWLSGWSGIGKQPARVNKRKTANAKAASLKGRWA